jgi:hypothetical protein
MTSRLTFLIFALSISSWAQTTAPTKTNDQIRQAIIAESIEHYRETCPCPYSHDRRGRQCGARSAYSKPGGASPLCYAKDVTQKMVDDYKKAHSAR